MFSYTVLLFLGPAFSVVMCFVCRVWTQHCVYKSVIHCYVNITLMYQNFSNIYSVKKNFITFLQTCFDLWSVTVSCIASREDSCVHVSAWFFFNCGFLPGSPGFPPSHQYMLAKSETLHHLWMNVWLWNFEWGYAAAFQQHRDEVSVKGEGCDHNHVPHCVCCVLAGQEGHYWWWWWCGASELAGVHNIKHLLFLCLSLRQMIIEHWSFLYVKKHLIHVEVLTT